MNSIPDRLSAALADRYRVERELGAGGMATVYLAADLKHDRKVAIKVLKPELAAVLGAERFIIEIKTTAALQHPHILPLFDSGEADGFLYYVMPYIQGETIREKLNRETQCGVDEAVRITREVADALDYAHRHGVIHRDIKPENILLHDGRAMVMDFGIALAVSAAAGGRMTETGLSLGTPHYMSPEQATAEKEISGRSDVYSLATVLYEMLAGHPPHTGASAQQIIMKIITEPAEPVTKYRKSVPVNVAAALEKALDKLPADRFASAKAFSDALLDSAYIVFGNTGVDKAARARGSRRATLVASGVATVALLAAAAAWMRPTADAPFRRVDLVFGDVVPEANSDVAISPDGAMIAAAGRVGSEQQAIYLRHLDGDPEFRKLAGTESGSEPAFSPDNQWIVFRKTSDNSLVKVAANGGSAVTVLPPGKISPFLPQWGPDDQIIFTGPTGEYRVAATGGTPIKLPRFAGVSYFPLPDGSGVLRDANGQVAIYDFRTDSSIMLIPGGNAAVYVKSGHILYVADGGLFAVKFDLAKRRLGGAPVRVLERVGGGSLSRGYAVSASGVLVQRDASASGRWTRNLLVIVEPGRSLDTVRVPSARYRLPRFSPDGRSIVTQVPTPQAEGNASNIHTHDLVTGNHTQLTFAGNNYAPIWSPDGRRILFSKEMGEGAAALFIKPADNSGSERQLTAMARPTMNASQWVDDKLLFIVAADSGRRTDVLSVAADSGSVPTPLQQSPFSESGAQLSPDRTLIAYTSNETGGWQLWLRNFPVPEGKWNVSRGQALAPRWSRDGRFVYFWRSGTPDTLFRARIDRAPAVVARAPEVVAAMSADGLENWDLHPDGRRFIVAVKASDTSAGQAEAKPARYLMLQNVFGELRRLTTEKPK